MEVSIFRKISSTSISVLLIAMVISAVSGEPTTDRKQTIFGTSVKYLVRISNDRIGAVAEESGMFSIGTADNRALLYGYPYSARTSHCHFNVDGEIAGSYSDSSARHPLPAHMVEQPRAIGDTIRCRWRHRNVLITQRLVPVMLGDDAQIRIEYLVENTDVIPRDVGILLFLDTSIGSSDDAPIATPLGYFAVEQQFTYGLPSFWQAFEESPFQPPGYLIGQGILQGWEATPPDILLYGDFWRYHDVAWDYEFIGGIYSDSAVLLRWNEMPLAPGETRRYVTYYGLGSARSSLGEISISLSHPSEIVPDGCFGFSPDTFAINLLVAGEDTIMAGIATIRLPWFLQLIGDVETPISPSRLLPGHVGTASWTVAVNPSATTFRDSIRVSVAALDHSPVSISTPISISSNDHLPPTISPVGSLPAVVSTDTITMRFLVASGDGIDLHSPEIFIDGVPVDYIWETNVLLIRLSGLHEGEHVLSISGIADTFDCEMETYNYRFPVDFPTGPGASLLCPKAREFTACIDDTMKILLSCEAGWMPSGINVKLDDVSISFSNRGDTIIAFYNDLGDGAHIISISARDALGRAFDSLWSFYVDATPPSIILPPMLFEIHLPSDLISFRLVDRGAGIDVSSISARIAYGTASVVLSPGMSGISYDGDVLGVRLSETGLSFGGCAQIEISVSANDMVSSCGPNHMDTLALRAPVPCTPPEVVLLEPLGAVSCDTIEIILLLRDDEGIIADSAFAIFNGRRYDLSTPELRLAADTLFLTIFAEGIPSGEHGLFIGGLRDIWGNTLSSEILITIVLDFTPPRILGVFPEGMLVGSENIGFRCSDDICGISPQRSYFVCEDETVHYEDGFYFDGENLILPSAIWLPMLEDETFSVCAHIADNVVECEPNIAETCVVFAIMQSGPTAILLEPHQGAFLGCTYQNFVFRWFDPDGLNRTISTISFPGGTFSAASPMFSWRGDTVSFRVELGSIIDGFSLSVHGVDNLGFSADTTWTFFVDRQAPLITVLSPPQGSQIALPFQPWRMLAVDEHAGIDESSISFIVNGNLFTIADEALWLSGDTLIFDIAETDINLTNDANISLHCDDLAYGCPNHREIAWAYSIFRPDFWWELLSPSGILTCDTVEAKILLHANFELDLLNCISRINGYIFEAHSRGDTLTVRIPGTVLYSGINSIAIWGFRDVEHDMDIDDTIFVPLLYDVLPPTIFPIFPRPSSNVAAGGSIICLITDDLAGVNKSSAIVSISGIDIFPSIENWRGDTLFVPIPNGLSGDVEACVTVSDAPQICEPHETRLCWQFAIFGAGPQISLLEPSIGAYTHDKLQKIVAAISSQNPISPANVSLRIGDMEYRPGENLTYADSLLTFVPRNEWIDGETVNFSILCTDAMGLSARLDGRFICDFAPPYCSSPQPEGIIQSFPQNISVTIEDDGVGVDPQTIMFLVGDLFVQFDNYALTYEGNVAKLNLDLANIHINTTDTIDVCVIAADKRTGYGEPNVMSNWCFWFMAIKGGCAVGPNPFTPNGDGVNDIVEFAAYSEVALEILIFSMDGSMVQKIDGSHIAQWDGKDKNGKDAPIGPYLYIVKSMGRDICKGTVVIAR